MTLSDEEARRRGTQKTVLERRAPPTFDILIEIQERQRLAVHTEVGRSVDEMLRGRPLGIQLRFRDENGEIQIEDGEEIKIAGPELTGRRGESTQDNRNNRRGRSDKGNGRYKDSRSNGRQNGRKGSAYAESGENEEKGRASRPLNVFAYGVARNRLIQAARHLKVSINLVDGIGEADALVTLKSYYRRQRKLIIDAQNRRIPVFVLRANTRFPDGKLSG